MEMELSKDDLENVNGGTSDPNELNMIIHHFHMTHPDGHLEDLLDMIATKRTYWLEEEQSDFYRYFRFTPAEMPAVVRFIKQYF